MSEGSEQAKGLVDSDEDRIAPKQCAWNKEGDASNVGSVGSARDIRNVGSVGESGSVKNVGSVGSDIPDVGSVRKASEGWEVSEVLSRSRTREVLMTEINSRVSSSRRRVYEAETSGV